MGDGDAVADARAHDLFAVEYGLQYLLAVGDRVADWERVDQLGDDILFGFSFEVNYGGFGRQDVQQVHARYLRVIC